MVAGFEPDPVSVMAPTQRAPLALVEPQEEEAPATERTPAPVAEEPPARRTLDGTWTRFGGAWCLRVQGGCNEGDVIRARRKDGRTVVLRAGKQLAWNNGCTIVEAAR
jgi:hypothetical protein